MTHNDTNPLVSVIIPTHNRAGLLPRAISSVLVQTYPHIELIVVDDGSTDNTAEVIKQFPNVHYIKIDRPHGANYARNVGIKYAKGHFITGLDDDDEMLPQRIEKMVKAYDDKHAYVCAEWNIIDQYGTKRAVKLKNRVTLEDMLYGNATGNQVLSTKKMFEIAGLYDERLPASQDYDMWVRLMQIKPEAKVVHEPLMNIYADETAVRISTSKKKFSGYLQFYTKHKHLFSDAQRKHHLLYAQLLLKGYIPLKKFLQLFPKGKSLRIIRKFARKVKFR